MKKMTPRNTAFSRCFRHLFFSLFFNFIHSFFTEYSLNFHSLFTVFSPLIHLCFVTCFHFDFWACFQTPKHLFSDPEAIPIAWGTMGSPWGAHVSPRAAHGSPREFHASPWVAMGGHGQPIGAPWAFHWGPTGDHGIPLGPIGSPWGSDLQAHGAPMGCHVGQGGALYEQTSYQPPKRPLCYH